MDISTIQKIIDRLDENPNKIITSPLGSGCHARRFGGEFFKVVIPGDTFEMAKVQLHYLLYDLAIDVGLSDEELKTLEL